MKFTLGKNSLYRQSKFLWPSLKIWNISGSIYKNRLIGGLGLGIRMILGVPLPKCTHPVNDLSIFERLAMNEGKIRLKKKKCATLLRWPNNKFFLILSKFWLIFHRIGKNYIVNWVFDSKFIRNVDTIRSISCYSYVVMISLDC